MGGGGTWGVKGEGELVEDPDVDLGGGLGVAHTHLDEGTVRDGHVQAHHDRLVCL